MKQNTRYKAYFFQDRPKHYKFLQTYLIDLYWLYWLIMKKERKKGLWKLKLYICVHNYPFMQMSVFVWQKNRLIFYSRLSRSLFDTVIYYRKSIKHAIWKDVLACLCTWENQIKFTVGFIYLDWNTRYPHPV